jgi:hypothetical protein
MICLTFCVACGDDNPQHLEHHHIIPRLPGGSDDPTNLITLCICHGKLGINPGGTVCVQVVDAIPDPHLLFVVEEMIPKQHYRWSSREMALCETL